MKNYRIKIFQSSSYINLADMINVWFKKNKNKIILEDRRSGNFSQSQSVNDNNRVIVTISIRYIKI